VEAAGAQALVAEAVVELARLWLGEHLVGLGRFTKALLGIRLLGHVRVKLAREPSERGLDLPLAGVPRNPESVVIIALYGRHGPSLAAT
jgi:hypothetical protein